jgi:hypothetical protein
MGKDMEGSCSGPLKISQPWDQYNKPFEDVSQFKYRPDNTSKVKLNWIVYLFLVYVTMLSDTFV